MLLSSLMLLLEGKFGTMFSTVPSPSSSQFSVRLPVPSPMKIWEELMTTFGSVQGFSDRNSFTSSKNTGFLFGVPFPVFVHSSL